MGQTVGGYTKGRRRSSSSSDSSNSSTGSLEEETQKNTSAQDDVTPPTLFPYTTSAKSPSNSDEPSMSSSIIETSLVKEESKHSKQNVAGLASKIIPKRAWSGYHLFQLANMRGERIHPNRVIRSPKIRPKLNHTEEDMDQLITMMKNHKVTDDSSFDFQFKKPLTPQASPQPVPATTTESFSSSSEFKFSFSANIPPIQEQNYVRDVYRDVDDEEEEEEEENIKTELEQQKKYDPQLNHRKILPLPKPRLKKSSHIPLPNSTIVKNNNIQQQQNTNLNRDTNSNDTSLDRDDNNKKKLKSSILKEDQKVIIKEQPKLDMKEELLDKKEEQKPDTNKRKERNWKDNFSSHTIHPIPTIRTQVEQQKVQKKPTIDNNSNNKKLPLTLKKKKGDNSKPKTNKQQKSKKKNKEEIAPGGFLSSDINLFENPISDDWICLFCQYDILFNGLQDTRKKNAYYRRKKERSKRSDLKKMTNLCYADDHDHTS